MCIRLTRPTTWVYQKQTENPIKYGPQSYLQSDAPDLIYLQKLRYFFKKFGYSKQIFLIMSAIQAKGRPTKDPLEGKTLPVRPVGSPQFLQGNCGVKKRTRVKGWSTAEILTFIENYV